jgi:hypothetical protein
MSHDLKRDASSVWCDHCQRLWPATYSQGDIDSTPCVPPDARLPAYHPIFYGRPIFYDLYEVRCRACGRALRPSDPDAVRFTDGSYIHAACNEDALASGAYL